MRILITALVTVFFTAVTAQAHNLWINAFGSFAHPPGHALVSLGWGHALPMDDMLNTTNGPVVIEAFSITGPDGNKVQLYIPESKRAKPSSSHAGFDVLPADIAPQKIAFNEMAPKGMYLVEAVSKKTFYTQYVNDKKQTRLALKPKDEIKDIEKVLFSGQFQAFAKSYLNLGKWTNPEPVGHGLEILPLSDLSGVRPGDLVKFEVHFNGNPLSSGANGAEYIIAYSPSFGLSDNFALFSFLMGGKAQFRVQTSGQWMVSVFHNENIAPDGPLKELYKKTNALNYVATLTFSVK